MAEKVGVVGLGLMGGAMSAMLIKAGFAVRGYDIAAERMKELEKNGGRPAASPAGVVEAAAGAAGAPIVLLSLFHTGIVREVCFGAGGIVEAAADGLLIVDTTTARPEDSEAIAAELREKGIGFLDASLSGSSAAVYERNMVAMVGGEKAHFDRARPVLDAFARSCYHLGENGAGARMKLIVNLVLGLNRAALAEGLTLGMKIGMDTKILLDVLKDSAAYSKAMDNRGQRMIDAAYFDNPASRLKQHHKDVRLMLEQGARWGVPLFFTSVLDQVLCEAEAAGLSDADTGSSIEVLRRAAGIPAL